MTNKDTQQHDLEYNDGLGDLLKEREKLEFSWIKTSVVFVVFLGVILGMLTFVFNLGKNYIASRKLSKPAVSQPVSQTKKVVIQKDVAPKKDVVTPKKDLTKPAPKKQVKPLSYRYKVITGTFKNKDFALNQVKKLKDKGIDSFIKKAASKEGYVLYRVQAGAYASRREASVFQGRLKNNKFDSYIILE